MSWTRKYHRPSLGQGVSGRNFYQSLNTNYTKKKNLNRFFFSFRKVRTFKKNQKLIEHLRLKEH